MIEAIQVKLWDKVVGYLSWDESKGKAVFKYEDSFLQSGLNPSPLDVFSTTIPANLLPHYGNQDPLYQGLPPFIADSLPDKWGNRVFAQWAEQHHLSRRKLTPLDRLAFMGNRGMGALEFVPSQMPADENLVVNASALYQTAQQIADERQEIRILNDENILLDDLYRVGSSAGGRRPKAIIAINQSGTEITTWRIVMTICLPLADS